MFRFVICLDVEADSLEEGYSKVYDTMGRISCREIDWISTDEVFDPDGESVPADAIQAARMKKIDEQERKPLDDNKVYSTRNYEAGPF